MTADCEHCEEFKQKINYNFHEVMLRGICTLHNMPHF